uniref:Uncharacterized protein K02A2.6-like n=1 Tax=Petromyzon marinus TaxID=7757 RepID=A0AAJ7WSG1_PETMA|nr:uncharacterized protein K02A2.6-like [Petromyzon marinus]
MRNDPEKEYNLQIEYRAGRTHANADDLSRRPEVCAETRAEDACPCFMGGRCRQAATPGSALKLKPPPPRESAQCGPKPAQYQVPLRPFRVSRTNQLVGIDLQGPFPRSHRGNRYILVSVEYFTRYPVAVAIPDKTALVVSRAFVEHYVLKHGIPKRVITDQGSEFEAQLFQALCHEFGIQKDRTTAYHPQANGMVERMNQTLAGKLKCMVAANQQDWDEHLPYTLFAYTTTVHTSTGQTLFLMMFGHEFRLPADLLFGVPPPQREDGSHLMETLRGARAGPTRKERRAQAARAGRPTPYGAPVLLGGLYGVASHSSRRGRTGRETDHLLAGTLDRGTADLPLDGADSGRREGPGDGGKRPPT